MDKKVKAPAIALIILGVLGALVAILGFFAPTDTESLREAFAEADMDPAQVDQIVSMAERFTGASNFIGLAIALLVIFGGVRMMNLKNWGLAFAASIVAMIPCWCCCVLGIPVGVWSIIVLLDKDVKAAFDAPTTPPPL